MREAAGLRGGRALRLELFALVLAFALCCTPPLPAEPVRMKAIELGSSVDSQGKISAATRKFSPKDAVFASIATEGGGPAVLHVRWYANRELLTEQSQQIDPRSPAHFVFQYAAPNGWPSGKSFVVFWLNDDEKHTAEFETD